MASRKYIVENIVKLMNDAINRAILKKGKYNKPTTLPINILVDAPSNISFRVEEWVIHFLNDVCVFINCSPSLI